MCLIEPVVVSREDQIVVVEQAIVRVKRTKLYIQAPEQSTDVVFELFQDQGYITWLSPLKGQGCYTIPWLAEGGHLLLSMIDGLGIPLQRVYLHFQTVVR